MYLARHGWDAIGIDFSPKAVSLARERARQAKVQRAHFILADVARPPELGPPFQLVLDIGCLHSIPKIAREGYASVVKDALRDGGAYLLYAFCPPDALGIPRDEVETLFAPELTLASFVGGSGRPSAWYRFARAGRSANAT